MKIRVKAVISFLLIAAVVSASVFWFSSCGLFGKQWKTAHESVVTIVLSPANDYSASEAQLEKFKALAESRLNLLDIKEYDVSNGENSVVVMYPSKEKVSQSDAQVVADELSYNASLTFRPGNEYEYTEKDAAGKTVYRNPTGKTKEVLMDGSYVSKATAGLNPNGSEEDNEYFISIEFNKKGKNKFAETSKKYEGKIISIWIDDVMISAPTIQEPITDGNIWVSGDFTAEEAINIANSIESGMFPFNIETVEVLVD